MATTTSSIDDRDPSVQYSGNWTPGGTSHEFQGTVSSSLHAGDSFTVPFTGNSITVLGTYDSSSAGVQTSYSIDGAAASVVTHVSSPNDDYQQQFWTSGNIAQGQHTLKVTMVKVNPSPDGIEGTVWFDFFKVTSNPSASSTSSSPPSTTSSPPPTSAPPTQSSSSKSHKASQSAKPSASALPAKKTSTGPIVGGVIAGLLAILGLTALFLIYRHRRRRRTGGSFEKTEYGAIPPSVPPPANNAAAQYPFNPVAPWNAQNSSAALVAGAAAGAGAGAMHNQPPPQNQSFPPGPAFPAHTNFNPYTELTQTPTTAGSPFSTLPPGAGYGMHHPSPSMGTTSALSYTTGAGSYPRPGSSSGSAPSLAYEGAHTNTSAAAASIGRLFIANEDEAPAPRVSLDDSVAALKKRQQEVVQGYQAGLAGGSQPVVQHLDSGIRNVTPQKPLELPPVYTPA